MHYHSWSEHYLLRFQLLNYHLSWSLEGLEHELIVLG